MLRALGGEGEQHPVVLGERQRSQTLASALCKLGSRQEEERHVGADLEPEGMERGRRQWVGKRVVGKHERCRGIGTASSESGCQRYALLEPHAPGELSPDFGRK